MGSRIFTLLFLWKITLFFFKPVGKKQHNL